MQDQLRSDREFYLKKLRTAILLLQEMNSLPVLDVCEKLDIEVKDYQYIVHGM